MRCRRLVAGAEAGIVRLVVVNKFRELPLGPSEFDGGYSRGTAMTASKLIDVVGSASSGINWSIAPLVF